MTPRNTPHPDPRAWLGGLPVLFRVSKASTKATPHFSRIGWPTFLTAIRLPNTLPFGTVNLCSAAGLESCPHVAPFPSPWLSLWPRLTTPWRIQCQSHKRFPPTQDQLRSYGRVEHAKNARGGFLPKLAERKIGWADLFFPCVIVGRRQDVGSGHSIILVRSSRRQAGPWPPTEA